jgi:hypothetical protein
MHLNSSLQLSAADKLKMIFTLFTSVLHIAEWYFRSSLDRYVWIFGMLCAWAHPKVGLLDAPDTQEIM